MMETRALFARHNLRCTDQRVALFDTLRACRTHPTAEELYRLVKPGTGRLSLATVYNTLEVLCKAGLCRKIPTTGGCCRYDADTSNHLHVVFRDTGEIRDVPADLEPRIQGSVPPDVIAELETRLGVEIEAVAIQIVARSRTPEGHLSDA